MKRKTMYVVAVAVSAVLLLAVMRIEGVKQTINRSQVYGSVDGLADATIQSPKVSKLVAEAKALCNEFVTHLRLKYMHDSRAANVVNLWKGDITTDKGAHEEKNDPGASFNPKTGRMYINPKEPQNYNTSRLQSKILHELAHVTGIDHGADWLSAWTFFLRIATSELGWTCALRPESCTNYNLCNRAQCPKCAWK